VVNLESHLGVIYLEKPARVERYRRIFTLISAAADTTQDYRRGA